MLRLSSKTIVAVSLAFAAGVLCVSLGRVKADPQPAFDRMLVERLVRAQEAQVHALEALTRAQEAQVHGLEALTRAAERCK
jgi:hypothetical protein